MEKIRKNKSPLLKQVFAFGLIFFLLISTCAVQRSLKTVFGIPIAVTKTTKGAKIATASYGSPNEIRQTNCTKCADIHILTLETQSTQKSLLTAVFVGLIFSLLFAPFLFDRKERPNYNFTLLTSVIPKYLLFSRLLFYDIR